MAKYDTSRYDTLYDEFEKQQNADATKQKAQAEEDYQKQLRQAYINRMQQQSALNNNLAKAGIRGGATETANLKLATNYENTRNSLNEQKNKTLQDITDNAQSNIFNYKQQNDAAKIAYIEQREAEDRQIAQTKADNELARKQALKDEKRAQKKAAKSDFWAAKYGGYYKIADLNKAYKSADSLEEKAIIKARINYLKQNQKGY